MQLAWVVNNFVAEASVYDQMSICYYYKGDLQKAEMYWSRYMRGMTEANFSRVKSISVMQSKDCETYANKPITKEFSQVR